MNEQAISSLETKEKGLASAIGWEEGEARAAFVLALRSRGIGSRSVLSAIERVPRRLFLAAVHHKLAYEDAAVPIECGQLATAPSFVARIAQDLLIGPEHSVLEIGTGSGYQAAVLAHLAAEVHSVERYKSLADLARQRLAALRLNNVTVHHGDGVALWKDDSDIEDDIAGEEGGLGPLRGRGPFDRIVLNGAMTKIPEAVLKCLAPNGILMMLVGEKGELQKLTRVSRAEDGDRTEVLDVRRGISLVPGVAHYL